MMRHRGYGVRDGVDRWWLTMVVSLLLNNVACGARQHECPSCLKSTHSCRPLLSVFIN